QSNMVQQTSDPTRLTLTAAVGPGQPNNRDDVLTVQLLLNMALGNRLGLGLGVPGVLGLYSNGFPIFFVAQTGIYNQETQDAIRSFERLYFNGIANPFHRIAPDEDIFHYLQYAAMVMTAVVNPVLSSELYKLAAIMVPGGADKVLNARANRTRHSTGQVTAGPPVVLLSPGAIRLYLPEILKALDQKGLADVDMLLMPLATIRAETAQFTPIDEGISKYNTSAKGTIGRHAFDLYEVGKKKIDLANLQAGDGERFKGRGFVQLTGRFNYTRISKQLGLGDELV